MPYTNGIVSYSTISSASRGAFRPTWELLYAHYAQIKGADAPWTEQYKNYTVKSMGGFEGGTGSWGEGAGHYDGLGWGSLLYHLDTDDVAALSKASGSASTTPSAIATASVSMSDLATSSSSPLSTILTSSIAPANQSSISHFSSHTTPTSRMDSIIPSTSVTLLSGTQINPQQTVQQTVYVYSCE